MQIGYTISGVAHISLVGWVLFGGAFQPAPEPFDVTEVVAISEAEFDSLFNTADPVEPANDAVAPSPAVAPAPEITPPAAPTPEPEFIPPASAEDTAPLAPETTEPPVLAPPSDAPEQDGPVTAEPVKPVAAPRVAPEAVPQPDHDDKVADVAQEAATSQAQGEETVPEQERTVEEAANTEIVTEAEEGQDTTLGRSLRPRARPSRPTPPRDTLPEQTQTATDENTQSAVDDLLAGLASDQPVQNPVPERPARPAGPPMTAGEKDALRVAVQKCWNTGSLSTEALRTTVIVAVDMNEDGTPNAGSIRMVSSSGGTGGSVKQAFQAARRAIIRCGARGFALPAEKYEQWREIEMTFNPEKMRIK